MRHYKKRKKETKKESRKNKDKYSINEVLMISILSLLFGLIVGLIISYSRSLYLDSSDSEVSQIISTYNNIVKNSYDKVDKNKLVNGAVDGMINSLDDPYSTYMDEETSKSFNQSLDGYYEGLGITVGYVEGDCTVIEVFENSPAKRVGMKENDVLVKINNTNVEDYALDEITNLIKTSSPTMTVTVKRNGEKKTFTLKRSKIELPSVTSDVKEGKIGYIKIDTFASNTANQFKKHLDKLEKENIKSLIIDLRDNPGGHLNQTNSILDIFFPRKTVLYQIKSKNRVSKVYAKTSSKKDYPVIVLINQGSASASEIVASCFKENYKKAILIGDVSYGKGTIQKDVKLKNGTSVKYTTEKWLTSKGELLDHTKNKMLKPDIEVSNDETDLQLQKAIEEAKKSK